MKKGIAKQTIDKWPKKRGIAGNQVRSTRLAAPRRSNLDVEG